MGAFNPGVIAADAPSVKSQLAPLNVVFAHLFAIGFTLPLDKLNQKYLWQLKFL